MSNQVPIIQATVIRDESELEGALLPASRQDDEMIPLAAAAYPVEHFEYTDATLAEDDRQHQQEEQMTYPSEQMAYPSEQRHRTGVADDSRSRVKYAERNGIVASDQELVAIRRNNRKVLSHDYFERQSIKEANRNARMMDSIELQGRTPTMTENRPTRSEEFRKQQKQDIGQSKPSGDHKVGGYEVQEYNMANYDTVDYNVSDYKSVYD